MIRPKEIIFTGSIDKADIRNIYLEGRNVAVECPNCGKHDVVQVSNNKQVCLSCGYTKGQLTGQSLVAAKWLQSHTLKPSSPCIPRLSIFPSDCFAELVELYHREKKKKVSPKRLYYLLFIEYVSLICGILQSKVENLWLPSGDRNLTDNSFLNPCEKE